jgi:hypothetical protein
MLCSILVRRLRDGKTFDDFREAWFPERGFGVPTRVLSLTRVDNEREVLTIGLVDLPREQLAQGLRQVAAAEAERHKKIDEVVESSVFTGIYELLEDHDFTGAPQPLLPAGQGLLSPTH